MQDFIRYLATKGTASMGEVGGKKTPPPLGAAFFIFLDLRAYGSRQRNAFKSLGRSLFRL